MRATVFPMSNLHMRPAFWGVDRDLKEVIDSIENAWAGQSRTTSHDFKETEQAYFLSVDLPGVNQSNLEIQLEGETLLVNATRKKAMFEGEDSEQKITQSYIIPKNVDKEKIQAHCEDGVLYLALPKFEKARPKKIEVSHGGNKGSWKNLLSETILGKKESKAQLTE